MQKDCQWLSLPTSLHATGVRFCFSLGNRTLVAVQQQVDRRGRMKTSGKKGNRKPAQRRPHSEVATATGFAIFLAAGSGTALAQDQAAGTEADEVQEVVVTGIRKSIQDSINVKKENSSIVEVVSAE